MKGILVKSAFLLACAALSGCANNRAPGEPRLGYSRTLTEQELVKLGLYAKNPDFIICLAEHAVAWCQKKHPLSKATPGPILRLPNL